MTGLAGSSLMTVVTLEVEEDLKGEGPKIVEVNQLGGERNGWSAQVVGDARFIIGERALVMLRCVDEAAPKRCTLAGLSNARAKVVTRAAGFDDVLVPTSLTRVEARPLVEVRREIAAWVAAEQARTPAVEAKEKPAVRIPSATPALAPAQSSPGPSSPAKEAR